MSLLIEQLTAEAGVEKTAEEASMEKLAQEINVLDQSRTLVAVGEEMYKIASELEDENLLALAADTYQLGERMGAALTKTASEDGAALLEALEIAEDMHKVASVYAELADEANDEEFSKLASAVVDIANELTEDANAVYAELEGEEEGEEEGVEKEAADKKGKKESKFSAFLGKAKSKAKEYYGKDAWKATEARKVLSGYGIKQGDKVRNAKGLSEKAMVLKKVLSEKGSRKALLKSLGKPAVAYGTAAAALAGAGYGAKKAFDK